MDLPSLTRGDLQGSICKVLANVLVQSSTGGNRKLEDNSEIFKKISPKNIPNSKKAAAVDPKQ